MAAKRPSSRGEVAEGAADRRISLPMEEMVMLESLAVLFVSFVNGRKDDEDKTAAPAMPSFGGELK